MNTLKFPLVRLTLFLTLGIVIAHLIDISLRNAIIMFSIALVCCFTVLIYSRNLFLKTIWFGLSTFIVMSCLGVLSYSVHDERNHHSHYSNLQLNEETFHCFQVILIERLKPGLYHERYIGKLKAVGSKSTTGKILLQIEKQPSLRSFQIGAVLQCYAQIEDIPLPKNPHQFNYNKYLSNSNIYHRIQSEPEMTIKIGYQNSIYSYADRLRKKINLELRKYNLKNEELAITNALLLGQRQDLERSTYQNYVNAGAIHILAVSGLHVGIMLILLNSFFKPIATFKHGKTIKLLCLLLSLWGFAIIAGLSASVTRAVTMFSIIAVAMHLRRPSNIYNTLYISAFFILLFKPRLLFQVGFQLSYIAVISIVSIQPLLERLWKPRNRVFDILWQTLTVTVSAQIGVAPISLFYFHQFPGLFFLSNLLILPFLGVILSYGLLVILGALLGVLPELFVTGFGILIGLMNSIVSWVSKQNDFLISDITFDIWHVIGYYLLIIGLFQLFKYRYVRSIKWVLVSIIILQIIWITRKQKHSTDMLVVFQKSRHTIIGKKQNYDLQIDHSMDSSINKQPFLRDFTRTYGIKTLSHNPVSSIYELRDLKLLVLDQSGIFNLSTYKPDHILLRNSPRINLDRLLDTLKPKYIIADGSNYRSYVERWKQTCENKKIPFHSTYEKGAFIYMNN